MAALVQTLMGICLFQKGPQDVPYAPQTLIAAIALSAVVTFVGATNLPETGAVGLKVGVATAFSLAFLYAVLALRGLQARFVQSATALFGTDVLIGLPIVALTFPIAAQGPEQAPAASAGILLLWGWHLAIIGHVFRHMLDIRLGWGLLLALAYALLSFQVVELAGGAAG